LSTSGGKCLGEQDTISRNRKQKPISVLVATDTYHTVTVLILEDCFLSLATAQHHDDFS